MFLSARIACIRACLPFLFDEPYKGLTLNFPMMAARILPSPCGEIMALNLHIPYIKAGRISCLPCHNTKITFCFCCSNLFVSSKLIRVFLLVKYIKYT